MSRTAFEIDDRMATASVDVAIFPRKIGRQGFQPDADTHSLGQGYFDLRLAPKRSGGALDELYRNGLPVLLGHRM